MQHTIIDPLPGAGVPGWLGPGVEIEGRYRILEPLGEGGVGMVWRAEHLKLHRLVAIKVLNEDFAAQPSAQKRFDREATTLASLSHPNIVAPSDYGVWEGSPYLVMELLEGKGLDALLGPGKLLPEARALDITQQLLRALSYAHARGVVHRDLKPGNVFLQALPDHADHVKLIDFGFARMVDSASASAVTANGLVVGTPTYMAPEAGTGATLDARADVYAVGVILFEMLTGRRPFEGEALDVLRRKMKENAISMRVARPELAISEVLNQAVAKALARRPEDRWQSAAELASALGLGTPSLAPPPPATRTPTPTPAPLEVAPEEPAPPRPPMFAIGALAVLGVAALVWVSVTEQPSGDAPSEATAPPITAPPSSMPEPSVAAPPSAMPEPSAVAAPEPLPEVAPEPTTVPEQAPPPSVAAADPWASDVPSELAALRRTVHRAAPPDREDVRALRSYAQSHREDPRPVLLLAHAFTRMHWMDEALETYVRALAMTPDAHGDPEVLPNLVALAAAESTARGASELIDQTYGAEAAPVVDATLAAPDLRPADRERLTALHDRLMPQ